MKNDDKKIKNEEEKLENDHQKQEVKSELEQELEKLKQKVANFENDYKRALADYQNLQKRVAEDKHNWLKIANKELLLRLLPVLDTLLIAFKHTGSEDLKVSINQFIDTLKAEGVVRIETAGKMFDPEIMEAIEVTEGDDGKVLDEVRAGFLIYDKLLRAAQVRVGRT